MPKHICKTVYSPYLSSSKKLGSRQTCITINRFVWFVFERARAPRHFLLGIKSNLDEEIQNFYCRAFQGYHGNAQGARGQLPSLPPWSIRPVFSLWHDNFIKKGPRLALYFETIHLCEVNTTRPQTLLVLVISGSNFVSKNVDRNNMNRTFHFFV